MFVPILNWCRHSSYGDYNVGRLGQRHGITLDVHLIEARLRQLTFHLKAFRIQLRQLQWRSVLSAGCLEAHIEIALHPIALDDEANRGIDAHRAAGQMQQLHLACVGQLGRYIDMRRLCGIRICGGFINSQRYACLLPHVQHSPASGVRWYRPKIQLSALLLISPTSASPWACPAAPAALVFKRISCDTRNMPPNTLTRIYTMQSQLI